MKKPTTVGKIRPGDKILKAAFAKNPKAVAIYEEEIRKGNLFDVMDKVLESAGFKNALRPVNEPFFSIWRNDKNPEVADRILEVYGERRDGDQVQRLYRFPVIFDTDTPDNIIHASMRCYNASGERYWSETTSTGRRVCMMRLDPKINPRTGKAVRIDGGRKEVLRPDNNGECVPEDCPQFQSRECNTRYTMYFRVPGAADDPSSLLEMETGSFYSAKAIREVLENTAQNMEGFLPRILQYGEDGHYMFWFRKEKEMVSMLDEEGKQRKREQWLIRLDSKIETIKLIHRYKTLVYGDKSNSAYNALSRGRPVSNIERIHAITHAPAETLETYLGQGVREKETIPASDEAWDNRTLGTDERYVAVASEAETTAKPSANLAEQSPERVMISNLRKTAVSLCNQIGVDATLFAAYATDKFGEGWGARADSLKLAIAELEDVIAQDYAEQYADDLKAIVEDLRQNA